MRTARWILVALSLVAVTAVMVAQRGGGGGAPMALTTTAWADGTAIPAKYTQAGDQTSPELKWANAPAATQSFVLHMHDPDAALNRGTEDQVHWFVWNIPGTSTGMPEGVKAGAELPDGSRQ